MSEPPAPGMEDSASVDNDLFPVARRVGEGEEKASPGTPLGSPLPNDVDGIAKTKPSRTSEKKEEEEEEEESSSRSPRRRRSSRSQSPPLEPKSRAVPLPDMSRPPPTFPRYPPRPLMQAAAYPPVERYHRPHHPPPPHERPGGSGGSSGGGGGPRVPYRGDYHHHHRGPPELPPRGRGGPPQRGRFIEDPLEEFNRLMWQKDREKERSMRSPPPRSPPPPPHHMGRGYYSPPYRRPVSPDIRYR